MLSNALLHQQSHRPALREHQPLEIIIMTTEVELTNVKLTALSWDHSRFQLIMQILIMFRSVSLVVTYLVYIFSVHLCKESSVSCLC